MNTNFSAAGDKSIMPFNVQTFSGLRGKNKKLYRVDTEKKANVNR